MEAPKKSAKYDAFAPVFGREIFLKEYFMTALDTAEDATLASANFGRAMVMTALDKYLKPVIESTPVTLRANARGLFMDLEGRQSARHGDAQLKAYFTPGTSVERLDNGALRLLRTVGTARSFELDTVDAPANSRESKDIIWLVLHEVALSLIEELHKDASGHIGDLRPWYPVIHLPATSRAESRKGTFFIGGYAVCSASPDDRGLPQYRVMWLEMRRGVVDGFHQVNVEQYACHTKTGAFDLWLSIQFSLEEGDSALQGHVVRLIEGVGRADSFMAFRSCKEASLWFNVGSALFLREPDEHVRQLAAALLPEVLEDLQLRSTRTRPQILRNSQPRLLGEVRGMGGAYKPRADAETRRKRRENQQELESDAALLMEDAERRPDEEVIKGMSSLASDD